MFSPFKMIYRLTRSIALLLLLLSTLTGCCSCLDPLEPLNRKIFAFDMAIDKGLYRPLARAYDTCVPTVIVCRIENFFNNLDDITNIANNTLQCKFLDAWSDCWRFAFNTTFGFFGFFDVATCAGLPKHHQDFGLTLARYGFVKSAYVVIPFLGPSTIRDTVGWMVDYQYLSLWLEPESFRYGVYGVRFLHKRAGLLPTDKLVDDAIDPYIFVRDAYLQKRACDIKSICPPCDSAENTQDKPADDDTFVADSAQETTSDPNDTFVADSAQETTNDAFVAESKTEKSTDKVSVANDDPFVP